MGRHCFLPFTENIYLFPSSVMFTFNSAKHFRLKNHLNMGLPVSVNQKTVFSSFSFVGSVASLQIIKSEKHNLHGCSVYKIVTHCDTNDCNAWGATQCVSQCKLLFTQRQKGGNSWFSPNAKYRLLKGKRGATHGFPQMQNIVYSK